jgi:hypothetical protein
MGRGGVPQWAMGNGQWEREKAMAAMLGKRLHHGKSIVLILTIDRH